MSEDSEGLAERLARSANKTYGDVEAPADFSGTDTSGFCSDTLFRPLNIGPLNLKNRIVMAPMTRYFSPGGTPGPNVADYYRRRIEGGAAMVVTEGTFVAHPSAGFSEGVPLFHGAGPEAGWTAVVKAVHDAGGAILPQLWHTGLTPLPTDYAHPDVPALSPSGLFKAGQKMGEPMTLAEIDAVVKAFGESAAMAKRIGCDGIQIHGAHGYLIDEFFWADTNVRNDDFGGDLVRRTRFAVEVIKECRRRTSPDFPISFRMSQWKQQDFKAKLAVNPQELEQFLAPLVEAGVDMFDASTRRFWEPEFAGSDLNLAGWIKKLTGKPTATVGSVSLNLDFFATLQVQDEVNTGSLVRLVEMMERGDFDLVDVGRALIIDPEWPKKIKANDLAALKPYAPDALNSLF